MSAKGLLLAFSEVGNQLSEAEYHDWYDNEHIPLRTALPGFLSATRLVQNDDQKPTWGALYDLSSTEYLQKDEYAVLAKTRSTRETDLLSRVGLMDRRVYTFSEEAIKMASPEFTGHEEGMIVIIVSMDVEPDFEDEMHRWYNEEHTALLSKVPGWLRTRRYTLKYAGVSGTLDEAKDYKRPPKFMALHEYKDNGLGFLESDEFKTATSTLWREKIWANSKGAERRMFKVYRPF